MGTFKGRSGKTYTTIEPWLNRGGEGFIYKIHENSNYVLKLYHEPDRTEERHKKLLAMLDSPLDSSALDQITWPIDVVYQNGNFVGYIMPLLRNNKDLNILYESFNYDYTLDQKIIIAKNLCAAINSIHEAGQVCGDLNPGNILVDPKTARITLVDTDSYHITDPNSSYVFRCEKGVQEYYPKELLEKLKNGVTLLSASLPTFTKYTDLFALAIHIFALLMNGSLPFTCAKDNNVNTATFEGVPQPIENIRTGFFPFYMHKQGLTIPVIAPPFDILPKNIQKLFIRAFVDGHSDPTKRPDCVEWFNALSEMEKHLKKCKKNNLHIYPSVAKSCPWCEVEKNYQDITNAYQHNQISSVSNTNQTSARAKPTPSQSTGTASSRKKTSSTSKNISGSISFIIGIILTICSIGAVVAETVIQAINSDLHGYWVLFVISAGISVFISRIIVSHFLEGSKKKLNEKTASLLVIPTGIVSALMSVTFFAGFWEGFLELWREQGIITGIISGGFMLIVYVVLLAIVIAVGMAVTQALPAFIQSKTNELIGGVIGIVATVILAYIFFKYIDTENNYGSQALPYVIPYLS